MGKQGGLRARGVANGYQALEPDTVYSYLVNDHWSPEARSSYTYLNLADETVAINWQSRWTRPKYPLPTSPIPSSRTSHRWHPSEPSWWGHPVAGPGATACLSGSNPAASDFDVTDPATFMAVPWSQVGLIVNASAYTAVDAAETAEGRRDAWNVNVTGLGRLVEVARAHRIPLVHVSTTTSSTARSSHTPRTSRSAPWGSTGRRRRRAMHWWRPSRGIGSIRELRSATATTSFAPWPHWPIASETERGR